MKQNYFGGPAHLLRDAQHGVKNKKTGKVNCQRAVTDYPQSGTSAEGNI